MTRIRLTQRYDDGDTWHVSGTVYECSQDQAERIERIGAGEILSGPKDRLEQAKDRDALKAVIDDLGLEVDRRQSHDDMLEDALSRID